MLNGPSLGLTKVRGILVTDGLDLQIRNSAEGLASPPERCFVIQKWHFYVTKHLLAQGQNLAGAL